MIRALPAILLQFALAGDAGRGSFIIVRDAGACITPSAVAVRSILRAASIPGALPLDRDGICKCIPENQRNLLAKKHYSQLIEARVANTGLEHAFRSGMKESQGRPIRDIIIAITAYPGDPHRTVNLFIGQDSTGIFHWHGGLIYSSVIPTSSLKRAILNER